MRHLPHGIKVLNKRHACPGSCTKSWTRGVIYHRMSDAADGVGLQRSEESSTVCGSMSPLDHLRTSRGCGAGGDGGDELSQSFLGSSWECLGISRAFLQGISGVNENVGAS